MAKPNVSMSAAAAVRKGYELLEQGDVEGAIDYLAIGVAAYPNNLSLRVNYANCLADAGASLIYGWDLGFR